MKALVIDDSEIQRALLIELLNPYKYLEIIEADSGDAAWEKLQAGLFPVLCYCDMSMPGMSGVELLQRCKATPLLAEMPFIFVTAATDRETVVQAINAGASSYVLKPLDIPKERIKLERLLVTVRERYSEKPLATMRRLGLRPERVMNFYNTLRLLLVNLRPEILRLLAEGRKEQAQEKLDNIKSGCLTLGLGHAVAMITHLRALEPALVESLLDEVDAINTEQEGVAQVDLGVRPVRKAV